MNGIGSFLKQMMLSLSNRRGRAHQGKKKVEKLQIDRVLGQQLYLVDGETSLSSSEVQAPTFHTSSPAVPTTISICSILKLKDGTRTRLRSRESNQSISESTTQETFSAAS